MKKKLNIKKVILVIVVFIFIIYGSAKSIREYLYTGSNNGKLSLAGYSKEEIDVISKNLSDNEVTLLLKKEYNKDYILFIKEKYFIFNNLDRYEKYLEKKPKEEIKKLISIVNVGADEYWYENIKETNINKKELMLVNKFNALKEDFKPENLVEIDALYSYDNVYINEDVLESFISLCDRAKDSGYILVASLGYRSYDDQYESYYDYKSYNGVRAADDMVAHPGHSEHQTGYAIEIEPYDKIVEDIEKNEEHKWLMKNAYKYGFILRYPSDKEEITGFSYEPWHFRYVGVEVASKIYKEGITFDEYYAYYVEVKNE